MPDPKPEFVFTTPPVACLFGEREHVQQLFIPVAWTNQSEAWAEASLLVAADNAARALAGRGLPVYQFMTCDLGTPEHQQARGALQAFLMANSPAVITANLWHAVQRHQRTVFEEHRRCDRTTPFEPPTLVFHLDSEAEFALVQQLAPAAIAVEVVARQPVSEATQAREGWPVRCTRIGARPDCPAWVIADAHEHFGTWAKLARHRVLSLARASLAGVAAL